MKFESNKLKTNIINHLYQRMEPFWTRLRKQKCWFDFIFPACQLFWFSSKTLKVPNIDELWFINFYNNIIIYFYKGIYFIYLSLRAVISGFCLLMPFFDQLSFFEQLRVSLKQPARYTRVIGSPSLIQIIIVKTLHFQFIKIKLLFSRFLSFRTCSFRLSFNSW